MVNSMKVWPCEVFTVKQYARTTFSSQAHSCYAYVAFPSSRLKYGKNEIYGRLQKYFSEANIISSGVYRAVSHNGNPCSFSA